MREFILGLIQGLTEFLPISSSGHLAIIQHFYQGLHENDLLLDVLLHLATLVVVVLYYRREILGICQMTLSHLRSTSVENKALSASDAARTALEQKMIGLIVVGTLPTALIGISLKSIIEQSFSALPVVGGCLLVTGGLLFFAETRQTSLSKQDISYLDALLIGTVQGIAIFPGISRSGSTISVAILRGIDRKIAAQFSFLLSIPAILGAVVLQGKDLFALTTTESAVPLLTVLLGMIAAFIAGYIAIATLIQVVMKRKLIWFSFYCWIVGAGVLLYSGFLLLK